MQKRVFISVVTYDGSVEPETGEAIKREIADISGKGWDVTFARWIGDSLIANARNGVVTQFFQHGADVLFFWDGDVAPEVGALSRVLDHPVDVVCGPYRKRVEEEAYPILWLDKPELHADPSTGLLEVQGVGMGFTKITRAALHRMTFYYADRAYDHAVVGKTLCLFDCGLVDGLYWGEDMIFCRRWREAGGQVWVDPEVAIDHIGFVDPADASKGKKAFKGHLGNYLRGRTVKAAA